MKEKIIKSYVMRLTKNDIINYALRNNITLTNSEIEIIYSNIKNNFDEILNNPIAVLNKYKSQLSNTTYNKLYELYTIYYPQLYH